MVSEEEKKKLKIYLGSKYTTEVLKVLAEKNITQANGKPYGPEYIRNIMCGTYENLDIEAALYEVYEKRKAAKRDLEWMKNKLTSQSA